MICLSRDLGAALDDIRMDDSLKNIAWLFALLKIGAKFPSDLSKDLRQALNFFRKDCSSNNIQKLIKLVTMGTLPPEKLSDLMAVLDYVRFMFVSEIKDSLT